MPKATGVSVIAYFVRGAMTTVQAATFEVTSSVGKFKVNCGLVFSPNIKKPQTAAPRYEKKGNAEAYKKNRWEF